MGKRTDVHSEAQSFITEDLKHRADDHVHENRRFTIDELHEVYPYFFFYLFCSKSSQFNSNTEKFVPDAFQECSQVNTSRINGKNSYRFIK
jgi:hypothetical protein